MKDISSISSVVPMQDKQRKSYWDTSLPTFENQRKKENLKSMAWGAGEGEGVRGTPIFKGEAKV